MVERYKCESDTVLLESVQFWILEVVVECLEACLEVCAVGGGFEFWWWTVTVDARRSRRRSVGRVRGGEVMVGGGLGVD